MALLSRLVLIAAVAQRVTAAGPPDDGTPVWRRKSGEQADEAPPNKATARPKKPPAKPTLIEGAEDRAEEARQANIKAMEEKLEFDRSLLSAQLLPKAQTLKELLSAHTSFVTTHPAAGGFTAEHVALFWGRLGELLRAGSPKDVSWLRLNRKLFSAICAETVPTLAEQTLPVNAAIVHTFALGSMKGAPWDAVWEGALAQLSPKITELTPEQRASLTWAVAAIGQATPELFAELAAATQAAIGDYEKDQMAKTAWGFATAGVAAPELFEAIAAETARPGSLRFWPANPGEALSQMAWAFMTAKVPAPALFDAIAAKAQGRVAEFKPYQVSTLAEAYVAIGHPAPALFSEIASMVAGKLGEFPPKDLAGLAVAFATAHTRGALDPSPAAPVLFSAMAVLVSDRHADFKAPELVDILWSFATLGFERPVLFDMLGFRVIRLDELAPRDFSRLLWAYAKLGHSAPHLFQTISGKVKSKLADFSASEAATAAWAYATLNHRNPSLLDALATKLADRLSSFAAADMSALGWAFAVFDDFSLANKLFSGEAWAKRLQALGRFKGAAALTQLHQWELWRKERGSVWPQPDEALLAQAREAFVAAQVPQTSALQQQVDAVLSEIAGSSAEIEMQTQVRCGKSGYLIDTVMLMQEGGAQVAVVVAGPSSYLAGAHKDAATKLNGEASIRLRQLRRYGWKLVLIPYWEWENIGLSGSGEPAGVTDPLGQLPLGVPEDGPVSAELAEQRKEYLHERLQAAGVSLGVGVADAEVFDPDVCSPETNPASDPKTVLPPPKWVPPPTEAPTPAPTAAPTTAAPTAAPTIKVTQPPTDQPTEQPTEEPTPEPTAEPTTAAPTTAEPTMEPTSEPTEGALGGLKNWEKGVRDKVKCWFTGLPGASKFTLSNCMGALALHMGSKLDAMWRAAQVAAGSAASPMLSAEGAGVAEPGCEWLQEGGLALPDLPAFPAWDGGQSSPFTVPPIPRLLPSWQHLHSLAPVSEAERLAFVPPRLGPSAATRGAADSAAQTAYTAALNSAARNAAPHSAAEAAPTASTEEQQNWTTFAVGAGAGMSAGAALALFVIMARKRMGRAVGGRVTVRPQRAVLADKAAGTAALSR